MPSWTNQLEKTYGRDSDANTNHNIKACNSVVISCRQRSSPHTLNFYIKVHCGLKGVSEDIVHPEDVTVSKDQGTALPTSTSQLPGPGSVCTDARTQAGHSP